MSAGKPARQHWTPPTITHLSPIRVLAPAQQSLPKEVGLSKAFPLAKVQMTFIFLRCTL